jgi:hypothetical protein
MICLVGLNGIDTKVFVIASTIDIVGSRVDALTHDAEVAGDLHEIWGYH